MPNTTKKKAARARIEQVDALDKIICYDLIDDPLQKQKEVAEKYGISETAISKRLKKPGVKKYMEGLLKSKFKQVHAMQSVAMKNLREYLTKPNGDHGFAASMALAKPIIDNPASVPAEEVPAPTFHDTGEE